MELRRPKDLVPFVVDKSNEIGYKILIYLSHLRLVGFILEILLATS